MDIAEFQSHAELQVLYSFCFHKVKLLGDDKFDVKFFQKYFYRRFLSCIVSRFVWPNCC